MRSMLLRRIAFSDAFVTFVIVVGWPIWIVFGLLLGIITKQWKER